MFLTRWTLHKTEVLRHGMHKDYCIHQAIYSLFPSAEERNFLYSVEDNNSDADSGFLKILVQSETKPLPPGYGMLEVKEIPEKYFNYNNYWFQVKFSPIVQAISGKKIPLKREEDVIDWLKKREEEWGVTFDYSKLLKIGDGKSVMKQTERNNKVTVSYVEFTGLLTVTDRDKFIKTVKTGIGRSKGFGFGLLQLKPILDI